MPKQQSTASTQGCEQDAQNKGQKEKRVRKKHRLLTIRELDEEESKEYDIAKDQAVLATWEKGQTSHIILEAVDKSTDRLLDEVVILISPKEIMMARLGLHGMEDGLDLAEQFQQKADEELYWGAMVKGYLLSPFAATKALQNEAQRVEVPGRDKKIRESFRKWAQGKGFRFYGENDDPTFQFNVFRLNEVFWPTYPMCRISVVDHRTASRHTAAKFVGAHSELDDGYPVVCKHFGEFQLNGPKDPMWLIDFRGHKIK
jgi:hypothetical protein